MRMLIAFLALALTLTFAELGRGAGEAQAATSCKRAYNACLVRCLGRPGGCVSRCHSRYRYCRVPMPSMSDLL
jgi:hypothetical protein